MIYLNHNKRKEVITYAKNERQQEPSKNQYYQRLRIPDRGEAKKAEAENVVKRLLASGMSADEILEKLK